MKKYQSAKKLKEEKLKEFQMGKYFDLKAVNAFIKDLIFWIRQKKEDPFKLGQQLALVIGEMSSEAIESYADNVKFLKGLKDNL